MDSSTTRRRTKETQLRGSRNGTRARSGIVWDLRLVDLRSWTVSAKEGTRDTGLCVNKSNPTPKLAFLRRTFEHVGPTMRWSKESKRSSRRKRHSFRDQYDYLKTFLRKRSRRRKYLNLRDFLVSQFSRCLVGFLTSHMLTRSCLCINYNQLHFFFYIVPSKYPSIPVIRVF